MGILDFFMNMGKNNNNNQQETKSGDFLDKSVDTIVDNNKDKFIYFENEYNIWKEKYYSFLEESTDFYNNKCCPQCGVIIEKELKKSIECDGCKAILLVKKHPELKNNVLIKMKDDSFLEKCTNEFKFLKFAEESIKKLEIFSDENYISKFLEFKSTIPNGYTVFDIIYRFSSSMYEDECSRLNNKLYDVLSTNDMSDIKRIYTDYNSRPEVFSQIVIDSLFETKSYNVLLSYLPQYHYNVLSRNIFFENLKDGFFDNININDFLNKKNVEYKERLSMISPSFYSYNEILKLLKEYNISLEDFKTSFFESVKESLSPFKADKEIIWKIIEKQVLDTEKYNEKIKEARKEARKKKNN